jgi:hypothetical protein
MKPLLILILSLCFTLTAFGQKITRHELDSLLKGTWKSDSTRVIVSFEFKKGDTNTVKWKQGKDSTKFMITNKDEVNCRFCKKTNTEYSLYQILDKQYVQISGDQSINVIPWIYVIVDISKSHLILCSNGCTQISYTRER